MQGDGGVFDRVCRGIVIRRALSVFISDVIGNGRIDGVYRQIFRLYLIVFPCSRIARALRNGRLAQRRVFDVKVDRPHRAVRVDESRRIGDHLPTRPKLNVFAGGRIYLAHFLRKLRVRVPTEEGIARLCRVLQGDGGVFDRVRRGVGMSRALDVVISDVISDHAPRGGKAHVFGDVPFADSARGVRDRRSVLFLPAGKGITAALGHGQLRGGAEGHFDPFRLFSARGVKGHRIAVRRPDRRESDVARHDALFKVPRRFSRRPAGESIARARALFGGSKPVFFHLLAHRFAAARKVVSDGVDRAPAYVYRILILI